VAGLVAITPACGFVGPLPAILIGLVAGAICYFAVLCKTKIGYDDALDVVGVHGVGGLWGALATGLFASTALNPDGANGLFYGHPQQLAIQAIAAASVIAYSLVLTFIILKVVDALVGLRVAAEEEEQGLDVVEHQEVGYNF
ncbi:MAG TPA: ammonium transporter, partial [Desulfobacteraceae bacterium]|nr:ammonium transporter [Desulfobacteraceae bacterium]